MLPIKCSVEFKTHLDKLSELPLYGDCKSSVERLQNRIVKSREGLLLEGDVEGDVKERAVEKEMWRSKRMDCETVRCFWTSGGPFLPVLLRVPTRRNDTIVLFLHAKSTCGVMHPSLTS